MVALARDPAPHSRRRSAFVYNAFNRRVRKELDGDGDGAVDGMSAEDETTEFVYGGQAAWQLLEEYDGLVLDGVTGEPTLRASYVYGNYIDELLEAERHDLTPGMPQRFYYH